MFATLPSHPTRTSCPGVPTGLVLIGLDLADVGATA